MHIFKIRRFSLDRFRCICHIFKGEMFESSCASQEKVKFKVLASDISFHQYFSYIVAVIYK